MRSEHEFFGELCDALGGVSAVLATGSRILEHASVVKPKQPV